MGFWKNVVRGCWIRIRIKQKAKNWGGGDGGLQLSTYKLMPHHEDNLLRSWELARLKFIKLTHTHTHILLKIGKESTKITFWTQKYKNTRSLHEILIIYVPFCAKLSECSECAWVLNMARHSPDWNFQIRTTLWGPVCPEASKLLLPFRLMQDTFKRKFISISTLNFDRIESWSRKNELNDKYTVN